MMASKNIADAASANRQVTDQLAGTLLIWSLITSQVDPQISAIRMKDAMPRKRLEPSAALTARQSRGLARRHLPDRCSRR